METSTPSLKVFKSSAGSGKTYQLVLNYLSLILKDSNPDKFKKILAITFTNKASQEMKHRVLSGLKKLKSGDDQDFVNAYVEHIGIPSHELAAKADILLTKILHNYGHLNILTIDKFVHKIIRSFSRELGLTINFELAFDFKELTSRCIDNVLQDLGEDDRLTNTLIEYYKSLLDAEENPNIEYSLGELSKILEKENSSEKLKFYKDKDLSYFKDIRKQIATKISEMRKEILSNKENLEKILGTHFTSLKVGNSKAFSDIFKDIDKPSSISGFSDAQLKNIEASKWIAETHLKKQPELSSILELNEATLKKLYLNSHQLILEENFLRTIDKNLISFALLNNIQIQLEEIKKENNIVLIGELNQLISDIIGKESAPYIYEKIGARFENYFIDEFQDTSSLQWQNLIPLIHDSLSNGNENLIVGDAKQSIYRWRGGDASQFIELPFISQKVANLADVNQSFEYAYQETKLTDNYRSASSIINFNNWYFPKLVENISQDELTPVYSDVIQNNQRKNIGLVDISILDDEDAVDEEFPFGRSLLKQISVSLEDDYLYKDIAVLVTTNALGADVAQFLSSNKIPVTSQESLLLSESNEIKLIYSFLKALRKSSNENVIRLFSILKGNLLDLFESYRIPSEKEFYSEGYAFREFLKNEFPNFSLSHYQQLSIYDKVDYIIQLLSISRESLYVDRLLNIVFEFQQRNGNLIDLFLNYFDEKIWSSSVSPPNSTNAVTIMTIHKSKGLQFPIVLIPAQFEVKDRDSIWLSGEKISQLGLKDINLPKNNHLKTSDTNHLFEESSSLSLIDVMNMIYVAFTRAEDRMYVQYKTERAGTFMKSQIQVIQEHLEYNAETKSLIIGNREKKSKENKILKSNILKLDISSSKNWREKLIMVAPQSQMDLLNHEFSERKWGIAIHEILSAINSLDESQRCIENFLLRNPEWKEHEKRITALIKQYANNSIIKECFSETTLLFSEREIGAGKGTSLRPDKVIIKGKEVIVFDFKTGEAKQNHKQQILGYGHLLSKMYPDKQIKMYLIYLSSDELTIIHV